MAKGNCTTVHLEAYKDDETGILGLTIIGVPRNGYTNAASEGALIAHDLIEHVNGLSHIGSIDDELEALGAIWYTRGQWGDLNRDGRGSMYSPEENIASDVVRMFRDHVDGGQHVSYAPFRTHAVNADSALECILEYADKSYLGEFSDPDSIYEAKNIWPAYREIAFKRMRRGYAKARRRWEKEGRFAASNRFWAIAEAVQPYCNPDFEGQRFILRYNKNFAHCEEDYGDENDY